MVAPAVIALLAVTAFPLLYNLWDSFHTDHLINPAAGHGFSGVHNYTELFNEPGFTSDFVHTIFFTAVSVGIEMGVGLAIAIVISKPFRGRGLARAAILAPWAVPTVVSAILWKTMVDPQSGFGDYLLRSFHLPGSGITWSAQTWTSWVVVIVSDA
ncbi:MAG: carbohydrate ABC transporter permease [Acidimicrobiales bacterium]